MRSIPLKRVKLIQEDRVTSLRKSAQNKNKHLQILKTNVKCRDATRVCSSQNDLWYDAIGVCNGYSQMSCNVSTDFDA